MASAYKGLRIQIGADVTKLSAAMRTANSSIYKTQTQINKLTKALKLDPGNNNAAALQMGRLSEQAVNASYKIEALKKGIEKLSSSSTQHYNGEELVDGETVAELANNTDDVIKKTLEWTDAYNKVNAELQKVYKSIKDATDGAVDLREITNQGFFDESLLQSFVDDGKVTQEQADQVLALKNDWSEARAEMDNYTDASKLGEMNDELALMQSTIKDTAKQFATLASVSNVARGSSELAEKTELIGRAADTAADRFRRLNEASKIKPNSLSIAKDKASAFGEALRATAEKSKSLKNQLDAYKASGIAEVAAKTKDAALNFEQAKDKVAKLKEQLELEKVATGGASDKAKELEKALEAAMKELDSAAAVNEFKEIQTQIQETKAEAKSLGNEMKASFGEVSVAAVDAAVAVGQLMEQAGSKIVEASNEVDSAYRDMRKTVDGTEEQYEALYDAAMKYSQTHVTSADTMLEMEALAGQVGISVDALQNFSEVAANLDVATDIDAEEIALKMGQMVNVMSDLDENNVQGFADALVDLGNNMPAQESSIMQIAQRLSSIGDVAGMTTPQVLGWAAAIASTGQRSEAAATGISTTITSITSAVSNGGDELDAFAKMMDMSADEFKKAWGEDASGVLREFIGKIGELGPDAVKQLEDLGIEGIRQTQTLLGLSKTVENVDKAMEISGGAWDGFINGTSGIGAAADEANKKAMGFSGSLAKMQNSAQVLAASLGEALAPYLDLAASLMQKLTEFINNLDDKTKTAAVGVGALAAAFSVVYPIVSALFSPLSKLFGALRTVGVTGIGFLASGLGNIGSIISLGFQDVILNAAIGVESLGTAFVGLATSGSLIPGIFGGVAIATVLDFGRRMLDSAKRAKEFDDAIGDLGDATDGLHRDLLLGKDAVEGYGGSYEKAMKDYEDFIDSLNEHTLNIEGTRDEASESIGMLEEYKRIIDEAVGTGDDFSGSYGELQWAIDGLNGVLGTTYDLNSILKGSYDDETGAVHDLTTEIDELIAAKEREIQIDAMSDIYTESYKANQEAVLEQKKAEKAYNDAIKEYISNARKTGSDQTVDASGNVVTMTDAQLESMARGTEEIMGLADAYYNSGVAVKETEEQLALVRDEYEGILASSYQTNTGMGEREGIMRTSQDLQKVRDELGMTNDDFIVFSKTLAQRMAECGISTDTFANVNMADFASKMQETGGDVNELLKYMLDYARTELPDKYANFYIDEDGNFRNQLDGLVYEWNYETSQFEPVQLEADTTQLSQTEAEARAAVENGEPYHIPLEADGSNLDEQVQQEASEAGANADAEVSTSANTEGMTEDVVSGSEEAAAAASESATVEMSAEMDTSDVDTSNVAEVLGLDGQTIDVYVNVTANTEGAGTVVEALNSIPEVKDVAINVSAPGIQSKANAIKNLNDAARKMSGVEAKYTANGSAANGTAYKNVKNLNSAVSNMGDKETHVNVWGNYANAASTIWSLVSAIRNLEDKSVSVNTYKTTYVSEVKKATGTYIDPNHMPKHAAGIFTRPTLTNIGWVGEDGAELYSGNSLVPLTNRKYSMPYINDISDAVAKKLGSAGGEKSIALYVTCSGGPEENAAAIIHALESANI